MDYPVKGPKLNLGCGARYLSGWVNCDFQSLSQEVVAHDLRSPLPFSPESFQFVYHSHVLEHLKPGEARMFLQECRRVLHRGGVLRTVVPDLEQRARIYLQNLEEASQGTHPEALARHAWMTLELLDQHVRDQCGGEMIEFILSKREEKFVRKRLGDEYDNVLRHGKSAAPEISTTQGWSFRSSLRNLIHGWAKRILGLCETDLAALRFERLGERHKWMYDRLSLCHLLKECGFEEIKEVDAFSSQAVDWEEDGLCLDVEKGEDKKPDSIYFESIKK